MTGLDEDWSDFSCGVFSLGPHHMNLTFVHIPCGELMFSIVVRKTDHDYTQSKDAMALHRQLCEATTPKEGSNDTV